ncbi:MAG TPA: OpgC domain-containing protein, partial [Chloroflexota bacterium]|nr:OpgC domain-containing protein [Chloroflexota bacterium]
MDFLRGYAAFAMVVDHLGGASFLYPVTGGNRFFVSAAEAFIFLSGLLIGLIYGPRIVRDGLAAVQMHLLRRAFTLYGVTLGLTFTFVGLSRLSAMPWLQDVAPLTPELVVSLITLHHTYYLVDVMLLYTVLLAISPIPLLLLHTGHTRVVVLFTAGLWLLFQFFPEASAVPWEIVNNETFNISAWQLWFYGGMVIGYHRDTIWARFARIPAVPAMIGLTVAAVLLIALRLMTLDATGA